MNLVPAHLEHPVLSLNLLRMHMRVLDHRIHLVGDHALRLLWGGHRVGALRIAHVQRGLELIGVGLEVRRKLPEGWRVDQGTVDWGAENRNIRKH